MTTPRRTAGTVEAVLDINGSPGGIDANPLIVNAPSGSSIPVNLSSQTVTGWTPYRLVSAGSDNATSVKAGDSTLGYIVALNINAAIRYLHIYNKASAPTLGVDTPILTMPIPGNTAGAGAILSMGIGADLTLGLAFAITTTTGTTPASGAVSANDITISLGYK